MPAVDNESPIRVVITPSQSSFFAGEQFSVTITFTNTRTPEAGPSRPPQHHHGIHKRGAHSISSAPLARPPTSPGTPRSAGFSEPRKLSRIGGEEMVPSRRGLIGVMKNNQVVKSTSTGGGELPELLEQRRRKMLAKSLSISISANELEDSIGVIPSSAPYSKHSFSELSPTSPTQNINVTGPSHHSHSVLARTDSLPLSSNHPHARKQSILDGQFSLDVLSPTTSIPPQPYSPTSSLSLGTISEASLISSTSSNTNSFSTSTLASQVSSTAPTTPRVSSPLVPSYYQSSSSVYPPPTTSGSNLVNAYSTTTTMAPTTIPKHHRRFSQVQLGLGQPSQNSNPNPNPNLNLNSNPSSTHQPKPKSSFSSTFVQPNNTEVILYSYAQLVGTVTIIPEAVLNSSSSAATFSSLGLTSGPVLGSSSSSSSHSYASTSSIVGTLPNQEQVRRMNKVRRDLLRKRVAVGGGSMDITQSLASASGSGIGTGFGSGSGSGNVFTGNGGSSGIGAGGLGQGYYQKNRRRSGVHGRSASFSASLMSLWSPTPTPTHTPSHIAITNPAHSPTPNPNPNPMYSRSSISGNVMASRSDQHLPYSQSQPQPQPQPQPQSQLQSRLSPQSTTHQQQPPILKSTTIPGSATTPGLGPGPGSDSGGGGRGFGLGLGILGSPGLGVGSGGGSGSGGDEIIDPEIPLPTFEAQPSMLAVDLLLLPGESKTYTYTIKLPEVLPPTYKGRALKFSYELVVGTCRAGNGNGVRGVENQDIGTGTSMPMQTNATSIGMGTGMGVGSNSNSNTGMKMNSVSRVMKVPIRVYNHVTVERPPQPYDILWPISHSRLIDGKGGLGLPETQGKVVEKKESGGVGVGSLQGRTQKARKSVVLSKEHDEGSLDELKLYTKRLLASCPPRVPKPQPEPEEEQERVIVEKSQKEGGGENEKEVDEVSESVTLTSMSTSTSEIPSLVPENNLGPPRVSVDVIRQQEEEEDRTVIGCREAVEILTRTPKKASYDVNKDGVKVAVLTFTKSAYRLGETVTGVVELNERLGRSRVLQLSAVLEAHESLPNSVAPPQSHSSTSNMKRAYAEHYSSFTLNTLRTTFALDIPSDASPAFQMRINEDTGDDDSYDSRLGYQYQYQYRDLNRNRTMDEDGNRNKNKDKESLGGLEWKVRLCLLVAVAKENSEKGSEGVCLKSLERDGPRGEWGSYWRSPKGLAPMEKPRVGLEFLRSGEERSKTKSWTQLLVDSVWNTIGSGGGGGGGDEQQHQDGYESDREEDGYDGIKADLAGGVGRGVDFGGGEEGWTAVRVETVECSVPIKVWAGNTAFRAVDVVLNV